MPTYETIFITRPNLSEEDEGGVVGTVKELISEGGGSVVYEDRMGRRRLAYPIQKFEDGTYFRFLYESATEIPQEIERRNRLSDRVMRSMTVRLDKHESVRAREQAVLDAQKREEEAIKAAERAEQEAAEAKAKEAEEAAKAAEAAAAPAATEATEATEAPATEETTPTPSEG